MTSNSKKCFIVCPIGEENSPIRKTSDKLFDYLLAPVCKELNFECTRSDKENNINSITSDILSHLKNDDLVIADLSEHNPNVFYEVGFRKALELPVVCVKNKLTKLPFDVYDVRTIDYSFDIADIETAKERIISTIKSINFDITVNTEITSKASCKFNNNALDEILYTLWNLQDQVKQLSVDLT